MLQKLTTKNDSARDLWMLAASLVPIILIVAALILPYLFVRVPDLPQPALRDLAAAHRVELGLWVDDPGRLNDKLYSQILTGQFSFVTLDGQVHWDKFEPAPGEYHFEDADNVVGFAQSHHLPVQAHHLVWDEADSLPAWLKDGHYTKQQLLDIMHQHIALVVGHYKGKVAEWTVVNEAFTRAQHIYGLYGWWVDHLGGTGYIDDAFRWAHAADPSAKLILNDFYNETETSVSNAEYAYLQGAKARGVPIDGIGIQLHIDAPHRPSRAAMIQNFQRFGALGFPVYITEFDVNASSVQGSNDYRAGLEAGITADAVQACVESKACVSFDVFGLTDQNGLLNWITQAPARSHLFTDRYQPKPSFYSFRNAWLEP